MEILTPTLLEVILERASEFACEAGKRIMAIYASPVGVSAEMKADCSPLTQADLAAHQYLSAALPSCLNVPILSEEGGLPDFAVRRAWPSYWLIDPLDGTKEFLERNGEFTVNIALVVAGKPVLGVVYAPAKKWLYHAICSEQYRCSYKVDMASSVQSKRALVVRDLREVLEQGRAIKLVCSRRHGAEALPYLVERLRSELAEVDYMPMGSALKFCAVAEGEADCYPRLGPTSEWDTAAAQVVVEAAGGAVLNPQWQPLVYNQKDSVLNSSFCVVANPPAHRDDNRNVQIWFALLSQFYAEFG